MGALTRIGGLALAGLLLTGCAEQQAIAFDSVAAGKIKTIGLVTMAMPEKPTVKVAATIGQSFGLIGAIVDAGLERARRERVWRMIDGKAQPPREIFAKALQTALEARGYTVRILSVERNDTRFLNTYPTDDPSVDAYLDIAFHEIGYGYIAASMAKSTPYRPYVYLNSRLVRASDDRVLMRDDVLYNPIRHVVFIDTGVTIPPSPAYAFVDSDAMANDPLKVKQGIDGALRETAIAIANLLR